MTFATRDDMIARFGERKLIELTDRADPPANVIDDSVLDIALSDADGMIAQALATAGLMVPDGVVVSVLVSIACDIALYRLSDLPVVLERAKHPVEKKYDDARMRLDQIAKGALDVPGTVLVDAGDTAASGIAIGTKRATIGERFDREFRTDWR